ncbi:MAG: methyltransferase domain-containing protein [Acidimicrobiia bacterium]
MSQPGTPKRVGILVVAYNAATTLAGVLDRIPAELRPRIHEVLVGDDASHDSTYLVGLGYQQTNDDLSLTVVRHPRNLGYGGNQKWGYQYAMEHGWDVVVLLHGDGQYAPEMLADMIEPLEADRADAVFGSRMLEPGAARRGGMPVYKYMGNRILTRFENAVVGTELSEWHSGYRAYSVAALRELPYVRNSDGFDFDTQIIVQLRESGKRIEEIPIPTYYGDEICYVDGVKYARDVSRDVLRYRAHKMGFGTGELAFATSAYELKEADGLDSSHQRLLRWFEHRQPLTVLDLGCSDGQLASRIRALGHEVTGVDIEKHDGVGERVDRFIEADLDDGLPPGLGTFDVVLAADVFEHVRDPESLLAECRGHLERGGLVLASVPNVGHWYPRARMVLGRFDYDRRGILDASHIRFFTRASFERLARRAGMEVRRTQPIGVPQEVLVRGARDGASPSKVLVGIDRASDVIGALWPTMFAYQFLFELASDPRRP